MKKYRIYVGSIQQETNSWSPACSSLKDFDRAQGWKAVGKMSVDPLLREDVELIAGTYAHDVPSGVMKKSVFDALLGELLSFIPDSLDGVFLYLHGALEVEEIGSGDAAIVRAVRNKVGPKVKIAVAMDFHANVSPEFIKAVDIACAYRTAPHVDMEETQRRACRKLMDMLEGGYTPCACMIHIPMLFTGDCVITENEPAKSLLEKMKDLESEICELTVCFGQPWVDTPWVGPSVTAWARNSADAQRIADRAARMWWNARREFRFQIETCLPDEALSLAAVSKKKPVFLSDSGDNTTAGAAGDRAGMLRRALAFDGDGRILIGGLTDGEAVDRCFKAGEGARISLRLGGRLDGGHSDICEAEFEIVSLGDMLGWYGEDAGRRAFLRCGKVDVIVTERRCAVTSNAILESGGAKAEEYDAVVVKLGYLYPELAETAPRTVFVMTEGASTARVETIRYAKAHSCCYPADPHASFDAKPTMLKET